MDAANNSPLAVLYRVPGLRQLVLLAGLALAITAGVTAAFYVREPSYSMLFSNVSEQEAGEIMNALNGTDIPHKVDPRSGAILVAGDQVQEARLKLASQGLPRGSSYGLEMMQENGAFGSSQFMENARYNHALETELARTISTLRPVQSARVHLALPESSVFLRKRKEPSASVLVNLYPGRELEKAQVGSIVHLVASSIPGMEADRVTVVNQQGQLLNAPGDGSALGLSTQQFEYAERIEQSYTERIVNLLTPMLGPDRIRATVTADMDFTEREETREDYDPDNTAVRSEQVAEDRRSDSGAIGGIPGALSNTPPPPVVANNNAANPPSADQAGRGNAPGGATDTTTQTTNGPQNESMRRTRNFEVDRTLSRTRSPTGTIRKLSVAVVVDYQRTTGEDGKTAAEPLPQERLDEITRLVKEAVGFNEQRGDSVNVSSVSFYERPAEPEPDEPGFLDKPGLFDTARTVLAGVLVLALAFAVIRPIMRGLGVGSGDGGGGPGYAPGTALPMGSGGGAVGSAAPRVALSFDDKVSVARQLADKNPERVAQIVRSWIQTDE